MLTIGRPLLESTDWFKLSHAYGRATDTPGHLRAFLGGEQSAMERALWHLDSAIIHQDTVYLATGITTRVILGFIVDPELQEQLSPVLPKLLGFIRYFLASQQDAGPNLIQDQHPAGLNWVQRHAGLNEQYCHICDEEGEGEIDSASYFAYAQISCLETAQLIPEVMWTALDSPETSARMAAAHLAVTVAKSKPFNEQAGKITAKLSDMARSATVSDERAIYVWCLGCLGSSPEAYLLDSARSVRICAALGIAGDLRGIIELVSGINGLATDESFRSDCNIWKLVRYQITAHFEKYVTDFSIIISAALTIVKMAALHPDLSLWEHNAWPRLLLLAFPKRDGRITSIAQKKYLEAILDNDSLLVEKFVNFRRKHFREAGLPFDREACRKLCLESGF